MTRRSGRIRTWPRLFGPDRFHSTSHTLPALSSWSLATRPRRMEATPADAAIAVLQTVVAGLPEFWQLPSSCHAHFPVGRCISRIFRWSCHCTSRNPSRIIPAWPTSSISVARF